MKSKKTKKTFKKEYDELMKKCPGSDKLFTVYPQWKEPKDFIVKFSLLQEVPDSITSTDTLVIF